MEDLKLAEAFEYDDHTYQVRLYNCVADLPATRAAMGLSGHSADQGRYPASLYYYGLSCGDNMVTFDAWTE